MSDISDLVLQPSIYASTERISRGLVDRDLRTLSPCIITLLQPTFKQGFCFQDQSFDGTESSGRSSCRVQGLGLFWQSSFSVISCATNPDFPKPLSCKIRKGWKNGWIIQFINTSTWIQRKPNKKTSALERCSSEQRGRYRADKSPGQVWDLLSRVRALGVLLNSFIQSADGSP